MPAIITTAMRILAAEQFLSSFVSNNAYVFIGATLPWFDPNNPAISDSMPPLPLDSVDTPAACYRNMMSLKKVNVTTTSGQTPAVTGDASLVIPRYDWTINTPYSQYENNVDLFNQPIGTPPFYVITADMNVYICLYNNGGANSTVMPTGTTALPFTGSDGYTWKFMYSILPSDVLKFVTNQWIPVKTLATGNSVWGPGAIDRIDVVTSGTQYTSIPTVQIVGDGVHASATATISNGNVTSINMVNNGIGYTWATVTLVRNNIGANGATAVATIAPLNGHGADPISELGGRFVLIDSQLRYDENTYFTVSNDYRQIGVVLNPTLWGTSTPATNIDYTQALTLVFASINNGSFQADDTVYGATSGATGVVMDYYPTGLTGLTAGLPTLRLVQTTGTFLSGEQIVDNITNANGVLLQNSSLIGNIVTASINTVQFPPTVTNVQPGMTVAITSGLFAGQSRIISSYNAGTYTAVVPNWTQVGLTVAPPAGSGFAVATIIPPAMQPYSGQIIYVENRRPISRALDQVEDVKICVEF